MFAGRQVGSGGSPLDSDGPQGVNWSQLSQPEIGVESDSVYLLMSGSSFAEYVRVFTEDETPEPTNVFRGVNGVTGVFEHVPGTGGADPDLWVLTDPAGTTYTFFGGNTTDDIANGQLWKIEDVAGALSYVGHPTDAGDAIAEGYYDGSSPTPKGQIKLAFDDAGRRYTYALTGGAVGSIRRLASVTAESFDGMIWHEVARVEYAYYTSTVTDHGSVGDLQMVSVVLPTNTAGVSVRREQHFRYYTGTYHPTTNPGHLHQLRLWVDAEGCRRYDWLDQNLTNKSFLTASEGDLKPYASSFWQYDSDRRVITVWHNGECGCSGGLDGEYVFTYSAATNSEHPGTGLYAPDWYRRVIVQTPGNGYITQYMDQLGQPLSRVVTDAAPDASPSVVLATYIERDNEGFVVEIHAPSNVIAYDHEDSKFTLSATDGLVTSIERATTGVIRGMADLVTWRVGTDGDPYLLASPDYETRELDLGPVALTRVLGGSSYTYRDETAPGDAREVGIPVTTVEHIVHTGTSIPEVTVQTMPGVTSGQNGLSGDAITKRAMTLQGRTTFARDAEGRISYTAYDPATGLVTARVRDADTTRSGTGEVFDGVTIPNVGSHNFASTGDAVHLVTTYEHDALGRVTHIAMPNGRVTRTHRTALADGREVVLSVPRFVSGSGTFEGPVSYSVRSHAGTVEFSATIVLPSGSTTASISGWIDHAESDPIEALVLSGATLIGVQTGVYDSPGSRLLESRSYISIPAALPGTEGTHYDSTRFGYDNGGRRARVLAPHGTISRTVYDGVGRPIESWMGTNDQSFPGGSTSGSDNMVKTSVTAYDAAGRVVSVTADADGDWGTSGDQRVTVYGYDARDRRVLTVRPESPHMFVRLDNLGRVIESASYSDIASITIGTSTPDTMADDRLSLSKTY